MSETFGATLREEIDLFQRSTNNKKWLALGDPVWDDVEGCVLDPKPVPTLGVKQGMSWKESLTEQTSMHDDVDFDDFVFDEDEKDDVDEADCPMIYLTKKEKTDLHRPWRQSLIIKSLWRPKAEIEMIGLENNYFLVGFNSLFDYQHVDFEGP